MEKRDYYEVLGVSKNSSNDEIKSAYRKLAMQYHPDRNPGDHTSEEKFKEAAEAYEVLSDSTKRSRYDQFGHNGLRMGQDFHQYSGFDDIFSHFSDVFSGSGIFDDFFGRSSRGGRGQSQRRSMAERGSDLKIRMPLSLEEIATGVKKTIKVKKWITCDSCNGTGAKSQDAFHKCPTCNGAGELRQVSRTMFGQFVNITACNACNGSGQIISDPCSKCRGDGRMTAEDTVDVNIPAGVQGGNYIPMRGKGNAGRRGGDAGDLIVVIDEKEHNNFVRDEYDVIYRLTVSYPDAALGAEIEVPTLLGNEKVKIESGTQPGTIIKLRNKGIPHLNSYSKGDQVVVVNIFVPTNLNSKEKTILKELAQSENILPKVKTGSKETDKEKDKDFFDKVKDVFF